MDWVKIAENTYSHRDDSFGGTLEATASDRGFRVDMAFPDAMPPEMAKICAETAVKAIARVFNTVALLGKAIELMSTPTDRAAPSKPAAE